VGEVHRVTEIITGGSLGLDIGDICLANAAKGTSRDVLVRNWVTPFLDEIVLVAVEKMSINEFREHRRLQYYSHDLYHDTVGRYYRVADDQLPLTVGYVFAVADTAKFEQAYPHLPGMKDKDVLEKYPAHLHCNVLPAFHGRGIGRRLIERTIFELALMGVPGVHVGIDTSNVRAQNFYQDKLHFQKIKAEPDAVWLGRSL
jgi:ribosomal protein S18 acetylase RimI-like enzyme